MGLDERLDAWSRGLRGVLIAAAVAIAAGLPGMFAVPVIDRDEARFAQATAQMLETKDFVTINVQDTPRNKKPIGIHWLQAISVATLSAPEDRGIWAYRLPSLLGAALAAAACAWGAGAVLRPGYAMLAGAMLGSSFILSTEAFFAKTDAALCGLTTLAMAALFKLYLAGRGEGAAGWRARALFWGAVSLATLIKGPVTPMVVGLALITLGVWERRWRWMRDLSWSWGLLLLLAVIGPWAFGITVATDGAFWGAAIAGDLAPKLAGGQESHGAPPGYHLLFAILLWFPVAFLLPAAVMRGWRGRTEPFVRFSLCWLIPAWLVFEAMPTKLPHYTLPAYGALAWLMASALQSPIGPRARWTGIGFAFLGAAVLTVLPFVATAQLADASDLGWAFVAALLAAGSGAAAIWLLMRKRAGLALVSAGALGVLAHATLAAGLAPRLPMWLSRDVGKAFEDSDFDPRDGQVPGPVAVAGFTEPSIAFTLGTETELTDGPGAAEAVAEGRPAVVEGREDAAFRGALAAQGLTPRPGPAVRGLDYSNGDPMVLRLYRPEPESQPETAP